MYNLNSFRVDTCNSSKKIYVCFQRFLFNFIFPLFLLPSELRKIVLSLQRFENLTCFVFPFLSFHPISSVPEKTNSFIYFLKLPINYLRSYSGRLHYWKTKVTHECREIGGVTGQNRDLLEL